MKDAIQWEEMLGLLQESLVKLKDIQGNSAPKQYACNLIKRIEAALAASE